MYMVDFHAHILPGVDDGSRSVEESLAMLEQSYAQGVRTVVASSHFYPWQETPAAFLSRRGRAYAQLKQAAHGHNIPEILPGAEVHYFSGMSRSGELELLRIYHTDLLLVEMPSEWTHSMVEELFYIAENRNLMPMLAHIDRYPDSARLKELLETDAGGLLFQVNASGLLKKKTRRTLAKYIRKGFSYVVGSDSHNIDTRPPNLPDACHAVISDFGEQEIERTNQFSLQLLKEKEE